MRGSGPRQGEDAMKRSFVKTPGKAVDMATSKTKKLAAGGPVANTTTTRTSNVPQDTRKWRAQQARFERLANPQVYSAAARARAQHNADIQRQAQLTGLQKAEPSTGLSWSERQTLALNPPQAAQGPNQKARNAAEPSTGPSWSERMTLALNPPQAAPVQRTRNADRAIRPRPAVAPAAPAPQAPIPPKEAQGLNQKARNAAELSTGPSWSERPQAMKKGGSVRGGGCAAKGVGKGKMR